MKLLELLAVMIENKATDLHLSSGTPPMVRIEGDVVMLEGLETFSNEQVVGMLREVMTELQWNQFQKEQETDFSFDYQGTARFRVNGFLHFNGTGAVFRHIPNQIKTMTDLGMGDNFKELCNTPRGLILVTGPTGSGKSTTLAAMIDFINTHQKKHILTIEDPIEYVHVRKKCLINQREVFKHTQSFSNALRAGLREDPDIILVGEMRDLETIRLALTAAETGHLVFGTLHTSSAVKTIDRIIDVFPAEEKDMVRSMLSESLQAVISQCLVRRTVGGMTAIHEIMLGNSAIKNLIRENKGSQMYSMMQTSSSQGMITLDQSLKMAVAKKIITDEVARQVAKAPENFQ